VQLFGLPLEPIVDLLADVIEGEPIVLMDLALEPLAPSIYSVEIALRPELMIIVVSFWHLADVQRIP
jgi:hypothetical protein